ncbi:DUF4136 domain-containing protein [Desulfomarina sp.]
MNSRFFPLLFFSIILLSGCATTRVSHDYDPSFRFEFTSSFNWDSEKNDNNSFGEKDVNQLMDKRFRDAIENSLFSRGFELKENPDLLVSYTYSIIQRLETDPFYPSLGYGYGFFGRYGGITLYDGPGIRQYNVGKLVISIFYGNTHDLVWQGVGTRDVFTSSSPEAITTEVNAMVESVLRQFPPLR